MDASGQVTIVLTRDDLLLAIDSLAMIERACARLRHLLTVHYSALADAQPPVEPELPREGDVASGPSCNSDTR
jgi:hypothetical protein